MRPWPDISQSCSQYKEWALLDRGDITICDAVAAMCQRDALNSAHINDIMAIWTEILAPIEKNVNVIYKLKKKSYKLYLLSNFHSEAFAKVEKKYKFFGEFDGKVISAHVHYNKPEEEIYNLLIKNYNITPKNALFIDDTAENIQGADNFGFNTIHYKPAIDLEAELRKLTLL